MTLYPTYLFDADEYGVFLLVGLEDANYDQVGPLTVIGIHDELTTDEAKRIAQAVARTVAPGVDLGDTRQFSDVSFH